MVSLVYFHRVFQKIVEMILCSNDKWRVIRPKYTTNQTSAPQNRHFFKFQNLLRRGYKSNNQLVKYIVPENQLLVFHVKQGWNPLCKFLDCPVPKEPFPKSNALGGKDRCSFYERGGIKVFQARCEVAFSWLTIAASAAYLTTMLWKKLRSG